MFGFTPLIEDTINGATILSVFDFFACFFVLYFIGLLIKLTSFIVGKIEEKTAS